MVTKPTIKRFTDAFYSLLVEALIPDAQIDAVSEENPHPVPTRCDKCDTVYYTLTHTCIPPRPSPDAPQAARDLHEAIYGEPKQDPVPPVEAKYDESKVPEKLRRLADGTPKGFCPVCGMPMNGSFCQECAL